MEFLTDAEFWARLSTIVIIDLTLAGDNALVIALAVRSLPPRQQFWGRFWGTFGAIALRLALIAVATAALRLPYLQLAGGMLLIWIATRVVRQAPGEEGEVRRGASLWSAVWIILVADAVMSLDNVLGVAAAAHGDLRLVVFGIALSLPLVVWGSGLLARLMNRWRFIIWLGGAILGYVAGEMMLADQVVAPVVSDLPGHAERVVPAALALAIGALGWWCASRAPEPGHVA